jgi:hypothetical protein
VRGVEASSRSCPIGLHLLDADPEAIAALQWINRRLQWEDQLAELHARAGIRTNDWRPSRGSLVTESVKRHGGAPAVAKIRPTLSSAKNSAGDTTPALTCTN